MLADWLEKMFHEHQWAVDCNFIRGDQCNVFASNLEFLGTLNGERIFDGILSIPFGQMQFCCITAKGQKHDCDHDRLKSLQQKIRLMIPADSIDESDCDIVGTMAVGKAIFDGLKEQSDFLHCQDGVKGFEMTTNAQQKLFDDDLSPISPKFTDMNDPFLTSGFSPVGPFGVERDQEAPKWARRSFGKSVMLPVFHAKQNFSTIHVKPRIDRLPGQMQDKFALVELFAGGFSGWSEAVHVMRQCGISWESVLGVEIDKCVAHVYACNNSCVVVDADDLAFGQNQTLLAEHDGHTLFRGSVCDRRFMKLVPWKQRVAVAMSSPCPPWTRSSDKNGLFHEQGRIFPFTAAEMRYLQPEVIAAEQVDSFKGHEHFQGVIDSFLWAGFTLIWDAISDLHDVSPISRRRWLGVFVPTDFAQPVDAIVRLVKMPSTNVVGFRAMIDLPVEHENELLLDNEMIEIYSNPEFMKKAFGGHRLKTKEHVLQERLKGPFSELSTVMAMYGAQHELPLESLKQKGLFTELTNGASGPRFWSPFEFAILHGRVSKFVIPKMSRLGHMVVGNSISVPQATLALALARATVDICVQDDPAEIALRAVMMRLHVGNAMISSSGDCWVMSPVCSVEQHDSVEISDTVLDESSDFHRQLLHEISPTVSFEYTMQVTCHFPDGMIHVFQVPLGISIRQVLQENECVFLIDTSMILDQEMKILNVDSCLDGDCCLWIKWDSREFREVVNKRGTWFVVEPGCTPFQHMKTCGIHDFQLQVYNVAFQKIDLHDVMENRQFVFVFEIDLSQWKQWTPKSLPMTSIGECIACLHLILPRMDVHPTAVSFVAFDMACRDEIAAEYSNMLSPLLPFLGAAGWEWNGVVTDEEFREGHLGKLYPVNHDATPVSTLVYPILRNLIGGLLTVSNVHPTIMVKIKFDGLVMWEGCLDASIRLDQIHELVNGVGKMCGFHDFRMIWKGKQCWNHDTLGDYPEVEYFRLHFVGSVHGGGAKIDMWREVKSLLAKELIQHGWPVNGLDDITSSWCQRIGMNKLMTYMKIPSSEKRWTTLLDCAKWNGLATTPNDPVRLKAIQTIQKAFRRNLPNKDLVQALTICPGFFHLQNGDQAKILSRLDLKSTGVCLMDFDAAVQWIQKGGKLVSDELAVVTLFRDQLPEGLPTPKEVTFPLLDGRSRQSIARGHLWQLGEKDVELSPHAKPIHTDDTIVLACTIWKDECNEQTWEAASKHLVKTAFQLLDGLDTGSMVLQVWGRCFRDHQMRTEPIHALSGQFHLRVFRKDVEQFLRMSGRTSVYFTPKSESHLSHPDWGMIWLKDKMDVQVACEKTTCHSGIARTKNRFALRAITSAIDQAAKEIRPSDPPKSSLPVQKMYKVEPVPLGITPNTVIQWAKSFSWDVKVIKMLGKSAVLLGTSQEPPHQHMSMGDNLVLIRPVKTDRFKQNKTSMVAGPKPVINKASQKATSAALEDGIFINDPWSQYQGVSRTPSISNASSTTTGDVARGVDAPTAAKFSALEERLTKYESTLQTIQDDHKKVITQVQSQEQRVNQKFVDIEKNLQGVHDSLERSMETAIVRAMNSQEKKMDLKFDQLLAAMGNQKRPAPDSEDDAMGETPMKAVPPPAKRL